MRRKVKYSESAALLAHMAFKNEFGVRKRKAKVLSLAREGSRRISHGHMSVLMYGFRLLSPMILKLMKRPAVSALQTAPLELPSREVFVLAHPKLKFG